ncbi:Metallo-dependent phosphatase-like protein [Dendryphion nanum]|uniref:Metallo-dependent phosphatase-like protein n=1 Tax=Dendryphion nanum TaxID=256645 RepID=A0A9P9IWT2_9PLEO|nr:Metallo-dependent phosphatase-like protein [Dendryphion nanum]
MSNLSLPSPSRPKFFEAPIFHLTKSLFSFYSANTPLPAPKKFIVVVCISDTHNYISSIPDGDILIHAGDLSQLGTVPELQAQIDWLDSLPHRTKIVIGGNHDSWLDPGARALLDENWAAGTVDWKSLIYLQDRLCAVDVPFPDEMVTRKTTVYGSPWVPKVGGNDRYYAFQYPRFESISWWRKKVPSHTEILVTHAPPRNYLDAAHGVTHMGCDGLLKELWRSKPRLHVFGHIHSGRGRMVLRWDIAQAAYERACERNRWKSWGIFEVLNIFALIDLLLVLMFGTWGFVKSYTRLDRAEKRTVLVNAAMQYDEKGNSIAPVQRFQL